MTDKELDPRVKAKIIETISISAAATGASLAADFSVMIVGQADRDFGAIQLAHDYREAHPDWKATIVRKLRAHADQLERGNVNTGTYSTELLPFGRAAVDVRFEGKAEPLIEIDDDDGNIMQLSPAEAMSLAAAIGEHLSDTDAQRVILAFTGAPERARALWSKHRSGATLANVTGEEIARIALEVTTELERELGRDAIESRRRS